MCTDCDQLPIVEKLEPLTRRLYLIIKAEKQRQHRTNLDISQACGIPISSVDKFFAGLIVHPHASYIAAVCLYLGISIDTLLKEVTHGQI